MALTDADLEGFTVVAERKPEKTSGVSVSQLPAGLVKLLVQEAPKALADKDYELTLRVPVRAPEPGSQPEPLPEKADEKTTKAHNEAVTAYNEAVKVYTEAHAKAVDTVKQLALYAAAWGKGQDPKLYITKVPNRKDDRDEPMARLKVQKDEDVSQANRPGRR